MMSPTSFPWYLVQASAWLLFWIVLYHGLQLLRVSVRHRLAFLELTPYIAFLLPLQDLVKISYSYSGLHASSIDRFFHSFENFFSFLRDDFSWWSIGLAQGLLLLYFVILVPGLYRISDRLWDGNSSAKRGMLLDLLCQLAWFHPLLYYFRWLRSQAQKEAAQALPTWMPSLVALTLFTLLSPLLPSPFQGLAQYKALAYQLEIDLQQTWKQGEYLEHIVQFGKHQIPVQSIRAGAELNYRELHLSPEEFAAMMSESPQLRLRRDGLRIHLRDVNACVGRIHNAELLSLHGEDALYETLQQLRFSQEFTVYLRLEPYRGSSQLAVITVSEAGMLYGASEALGKLLSEVASVRRQSRSQQMQPEPEPSPFSFHWGTVELPLRKLNNSNDYAAELELSIDSLEAIADSAMYFAQQGLLLPIQDIRLHCFNPFIEVGQLRRHSYTLLTHENKAYLKEPAQGAGFRQQVKPGLVITIFARLDGININTINLQLGDPMGLYRPEFRIPPPGEEAPAYSFQLLDRDGFKSILKIDTCLLQNQRILDMYRDPERYVVQHIAGFSTNERFVRPDPEWIDALRSSGSEYHCTFYTDTLPEWYGHLGKTTQLRWGKMSAMPNSEVHSWEEFLENRDQGLQLWIDNTPVALHKATLYLIHEGQPLAFEVLDSSTLHCPEKLELWKQVRPKTTCYLEGLVLRDSTGQLHHAPLRFTFSIGPPIRDQGYQVKIAHRSTPPAEAPMHELTENGFNFRHYPLPLLIGQLLFGFETLPDSYIEPRLEILGNPEPVWVDVSFEGPGISEGQAFDLALKALKKTFRFNTQPGRIQGDSWQLQISNFTRLQQASTPQYNPELERVRRYSNGVHELNGFTLPELAFYLEEQFQEHFEYNLFYLSGNDERYRFALSFSSLEVLRQQLQEEYGLILNQSDYMMQGWSLRFGK